MTVNVYGTRVTQAYLNRRAAAQAGGPPVNFVAGTLIVGDGNGAVPLLSDLVTAGHVAHEVWRSNTAIHGVYVNATTPSQIDISVVIPASDGNGGENGPWWVREFAITDENGVVMLFGITQLEKTTSAQNGQTSDLAWLASINEANADVVVITPPSGAFATNADVEALIAARTPTAAQPLYAVDSTPAGHLHREFHVEIAAQDATHVDPAKLGVSRPAGDDEFAAGQAAAGSLALFPWATLAQIKNALADLATSIINTVEAWVLGKLPADTALWHIGSATTGGATDLHTTIAPQPAAAGAGLCLRVPITTSNGAAPTLTFNTAAGAVTLPIVSNASGAALKGGEMPGGVGYEADLECDGTSLRLLNGGRGVWQVFFDSGFTTTTLASIIATIPDWVTVLRISAFAPGVDGTGSGLQNLGMRLSFDGGATFRSGAAEYSSQWTGALSNGGPFYGNTFSLYVGSVASFEDAWSESKLLVAGPGKYANLIVDGMARNAANGGSPPYNDFGKLMGQLQIAGRVNALQIITTSNFGIAAGTNLQPGVRIILEGLH